MPEANALAQKNPEKLAEPNAKFVQAVETFGIHPQDDRGARRLAVPKPLPLGAVEVATTLTYHAGATRIAGSVAPPVKNGSWALTAKVSSKGKETQGVIMSFGGQAAGMSLYLEAGVPVFDYHYVGKHTMLKGVAPISEASTILVVFAHASGDKPDAGAASSGQAQKRRQRRLLSDKPSGLLATIHPWRICLSSKRRKRC